VALFVSVDQHDVRLDAAVGGEHDRAWAVVGVKATTACKLGLPYPLRVSVSCEDPESVSDLRAEMPAVFRFRQEAQ